MPRKAESFTAVMEDIEKAIMPGVTHWNHPNFFAYYGSGNAYPSLLGDMLSSGIAPIGFSWVSLDDAFSKEGFDKSLLSTHSGVMSSLDRARDNHARLVRESIGSSGFFPEQKQQPGEYRRWRNSRIGIGCNLLMHVRGPSSSDSRAERRELRDPRQCLPSPARVLYFE